MYNKILIDFNSFSFKYKENQEFIFENTSFSIVNNSVNFVIGDNGSGKTTLFKIIFHNYLYKNYNEFIKINTKDIGFIWDFHNFYPKLTVYQNIKLYFELSKNRNLKIDFNKNLDLFFQYFKIEKNYLNKTIDELSFGYKQKILIIRELITFKELVLIDEPFLGLDYSSYYSFLKILADFYNHISFIIFTQNPNVISDFNNLIKLNLNKISLNSKITLFSLF